MKSRIHAIAGVVLITGTIIGGTAGITLAKSHKDRTVLEADTMVGVARPYTGAANAIRGINGGGVPWSIDEAKAELKASGKLEVEVEGLVVTSSGVNPAATFKVTVSCLSIDSTDPLNPLAVTRNVSTDPFPADAAGNAEVEAMIALPSPCIAPIIFVANGGSGSWFAATGV